MIGEPVRRRADTLLRELVEPSGEFTFERREPMAAKGLDGEHVMHAAGWM